MEAEKYKEVPKLLSSWYKKNCRVLPWRENPSLYKTVVSEFMLQQTKVSTVLPYFKRWVEALPDFSSLANAPEEVVMKYWEGLGYYSRARNLQKLAQDLVTLKTIPQDALSWQKFKGVGDYTSAAITSISFGYPKAAVDGNVIRIVTRLLADSTTYSSNTTATKALTPFAQTLVDTADPNTHNQAMMELGATICLKKKPLCLLCPLQKHCLGHKSHMPESYPKIIRPKQVKIIINRALVANSHGLLLFKHQSQAKRLANIFEIPTLDSLGIRVNKTPPMFSKKRGISNQIIEEFFFEVPFCSKKLTNWLTIENLQWVALEQLPAITLSGPHRKWIQSFLKH